MKNSEHTEEVYKEEHNSIIKEKKIKGGSGGPKLKQNENGGPGGTAGGGRQGGGRGARGEVQVSQRLCHLMAKKEGK